MNWYYYLRCCQKQRVKNWSEKWFIWTRDNNNNMDLNSSLSNYKTYLEKILQDPSVFERFRCLSWYDSLGCFCDPDSACHTDIIRVKLGEMGLKVPNRQCVKTKWLRKQTSCDNLEEWQSNPKNMLCTRHGRVFIHKNGTKKVYHYKASEWANPYKVKK